MTTSSQVLISGVRYRLREYEQGVAFRERTEPALERQGAVAGASFSGQTDPRPDILTRKYDDWSGGEMGDVPFDSANPLHRNRYVSSTAPLDVRTSGKVTLGEDVVVSMASTAATTAGPHLVSVYNAGTATETVFVFYDTAAKERTTSPDTWTARTLTGATNGVTGPVDAFGGNIFYGENRGVGSRLRKYTPISGNPTVVVVNAQGATSPVVTNNRVFYIKASGLLYNLPTDATTAGTSTYANVGITTETAFSNLVFVGPKIFWAYREQGSDHRLFIYDGTAGSERAMFPKGFIVGNGAGSGPYEWLCAQNDVVFFCGYFPGTTDRPAIGYLTEDSLLGLDIIRDGTSDRPATLAATQRNEVLIGMNSGRIFRYDMSTGGISLFADLGSTISLPGSILYSTSGHYYYATRESGTMANVRVYRNTPGVYVSASTVTHLMWDFDLPGEEKILTEVEVHCDPLPSGTSIQLEYYLDGSTSAVTTDRNGGALTVSGAGTTRALFQMDDKFRYYQMKAVLNRGATTTVRPSLLSVTDRCVTVNFVTFYDLTIDVANESASDHKTGQQLTGKKIADNLRTLRDTKTVFSMTPFYVSPGAPYPGPTGTAVSCVVRDVDFRLDSRGEGVAQVTLRAV